MGPAPGGKLQHGRVDLGLVLGVLLILVSAETSRTGENPEIRTSAALLVTAYAGVLSGQGHALVATAVGVTAAALQAWKEPLAGFSQALTSGEVRSAILLAILAFVVYPTLPTGPVDPWHLIEPRTAWVTVILIAALGFVNYVRFMRRPCRSGATLRSYGLAGVVAEWLKAPVC
jgi:uncharacterized membrane protein (DUF4010 family)